MNPRELPRILNLQYRRRLESFEAERPDRPEHPCRAGCDACCYGPFDVGAADLWSLIEGLSELGASTRRAVMHQAAEQARRQRAEVGVDLAEVFSLEDVGETIFDAMCDKLSELPCPFLIESRCAAYEHRPQMCRLTGDVYVDGDEQLDLSCPIDLTKDVPAVRADFGALDLDIARLERDLDLPAGVLRGRTTIALGVDALLRFGWGG